MPVYQEYVSCLFEPAHIGTYCDAIPLILSAVLLPIKSSVTSTEVFFLKEFYMHL